MVPQLQLTFILILGAMMLTAFVGIVRLSTKNAMKQAVKKMSDVRVLGASGAHDLRVQVGESRVRLRWTRFDTRGSEVVWSTSAETRADTSTLTFTMSSDDEGASFDDFHLQAEPLHVFDAVVKREVRDAVAHLAPLECSAQEGLLVLSIQTEFAPVGADADADRLASMLRTTVALSKALAHAGDHALAAPEHRGASYRG